MSGSVGVGEVGAAFVVDDKATGPLSRIGEAFAQVQAGIDEAATAAEEFAAVRFTGLTRSLGALGTRLDEVAAAGTRLSELRFGNTARSVRNLTDAMTELGDTASALPMTIESAMNKVIAETDRATASMRGLRREMLSVDAAGGGRGGGVPPIIPGGRGRGGGEREPGGFRPHGRVHLSEGGVGAGMTGYFGGAGMMVGLGTGLLAYHAVHTAAEYDLAIRNTLMNLGISDPDSPEGRRVRPIIEEGLQQAASGTIFSQQQLSGAGAQFAGIFASAIPEDVPGTLRSPEEKARAMAGIEGRVFRFAETETQMGFGNLEENMKAGVFLSHLTRQYTPEGLGGSLDRLLAISRMTGASPQEVERIMKYSVTTGGLAGIDPNDIMTATGFLIQSGITGSTAGTGLAQVIQGIIQGEAPATGRGHRLSESQEHENLVRALHGTVGLSRRRGESESAHDRRLTALQDLGILGPGGKPVAGVTDAKGDLLIMPIIEALSKYADTHTKEELAVKESQAFSVRGARATEPFIGKEQLQLFEQYKNQEQEFTTHVGVLVTQSGQAASAMQSMQQVWARFNDLLLAAVGPLDEFAKDMKGVADQFDSWAKWLRANPAPQLTAQSVVHDTMHPTDLPKTGLLGGLLDHLGIHIPALNAPDTYHPPPNFVPADPHSGVANPNIHRESYIPGSGEVQVHISNITFTQGDMQHQVDEFVRMLTERLSRAQLNDLSPGGGHLQSPYSTGKTVSI